MHSASEEWVARVAARNEIEEAKAMRGLRAVALSAGAKPTWWKPLSPKAELAATVARQKEG